MADTLPSLHQPAVIGTDQNQDNQVLGPEQQWVGATHLEVQGHEGDSGQKDLQQGKQIDETMFADVRKVYTRLQGTSSWSLLVCCTSSCQAQ